MKRLVSTTHDLEGSDPGSAGALIRYAYNVRDDLTPVIDPDGNATDYVYDDLGNLLSQNSPGTGTTTYGYDAAGNLTSRSDTTPIPRREATRRSRTLQDLTPSTFG